MMAVDAINGKADPPEPNEVPSQFVLECLAAESEGDGMLFAALLQNKLLYATSNGSWYVWRKHAWQRDKVGVVPGLVRYVTERYGEEILAFEAKIDESKQENGRAPHGRVD